MATVVSCMFREGYPHVQTPRLHHHRLARQRPSPGGGQRTWRAGQVRLKLKAELLTVPN